MGRVYRGLREGGTQNFWIWIVQICIIRIWWRNLCSRVVWLCSSSQSHIAQFSILAIQCDAASQPWKWKNQSISVSEVNESIAASSVDFFISSCFSGIFAHAKKLIKSLSGCFSSRRRESENSSALARDSREACEYFYQLEQQQQQQNNTNLYYRGRRMWFFSKRDYERP